MTAERIPLLVFRPARPMGSFETWVFRKLTPSRRRALVAGLTTLLPEWSSAIRTTGLGRRHGPELKELRIRVDEPAPRPRTGGTQGHPPRPAVLSVYSCVEDGAVVLLSGVAATARERKTWPGTPGLGDGRGRLRDLQAARAAGEVITLQRLDLCELELTPNQPQCAAPRRRRGAPRSTHGPALVEFDVIREQIWREAREEGTTAIGQLQAFEDRYRLAWAVVRRRSELSLTQQQVAARSGVPRTDVGRIEHGALNPTLATLGQLARALDIELRIGRQGLP